MKFKKNVFSNLVLHILSIGIGFFTSILVARGLGADSQGQFSYYLLIFGIIASYGHIGVTSSTSYFIKRTNFKKENIINTNISTLLLLSVIYIIIVALYRNIIFSSYVCSLVIIWIIYAVTMLFNNFFVTIYVSEENIYVYNRFFILVNILKGIMIVALYFSNNLNIITISIIYSLLEVIKLILLLNGLKLKYKFKINTDILKQELKYGIPLYLAALFIYLNYRADQIMVKNFLGNLELGIYAISVQLAELAFIFPESIASAFEGRLYGCKKEERKVISAQIIKFTFYSTLAICMIGILCKPLVTVLYGEEYERAGISMIILLIGIIFASIGKVSPAYFYTEGNPKIHLKVSSAVLVINVILNAIFIPKIGINGAALASTISYLFYGLVYVILLKKEGISIKKLLFLQKSDFREIKNIVLRVVQKKQEEKNV